MLPRLGWGRAPLGGGVFVSDIFNEVDEEVRREQLKKLWERYSNLIIGVAILVVAAVGAWRGYEFWQARKAAEAGAAYEAALKLSEDGKHTEAEEAFGKLAAQGTSGYRILARVRQAAELGAVDPKAGIAAYDAIAGEPGPQLIREIAAIRAAFLLVDTAKFDEMAPAQLAGQFRTISTVLITSVGGAAGQFWYFGDERAVFIAPVENDLVFCHSASSASLY